MDIARVDAADLDSVTAYVDLRNAVAAVDAPWLRSVTVPGMRGELVHGWDGEPETAYLARVDGAVVAFGTVGTTDWDNRHLAWIGTRVHPDHRRRGHGSQVLDFVLAESRSRGRTTFGIDGWESEASRAFATAHGFEPGSATINRRQVVADVDLDEVRTLHDGALAHAGDYELLRRPGAVPDEELEAVAEMAGAINDAPTDDLDLEDEVISPGRVRAYEAAQAACGYRLYRVLARHRPTGRLAGHSVVAVDGERPTDGFQHDTSVVAAHRGHRLGLLLKTEMSLWLHDAEPGLATIDTWNAESNTQMVAVNDLLGYRPQGRLFEYQLVD